MEALVNQLTSTLIIVTHILNIPGLLRPEYYQTYTNYLIRFLDEYKKHGISFTSISTGNEPNYIPEYPLNLSSMTWTSSSTIKWVSENLGPSLAKSQHKTEIYGFDDQRTFLPYQMQMIFDNEDVEKYITAIGIHWYRDNLTSPYVLDKTHYLYPDKSLWITEACLGALFKMPLWEGSCVKYFFSSGASPSDQPKVRLGSWQRAEYYISKMIEVHLDTGIRDFRNYVMCFSRTSIIGSLAGSTGTSLWIQTEGQIGSVTLWTLQSSSTRKKTNFCWIRCSSLSFIFPDSCHETLSEFSYRAIRG